MEKKRINVSVSDFKKYDLEGPVDEVIERIKKYRDIALSAGYTDIKIEEDYNYESSDFDMIGWREESDEEFERRVKKAEAFIKVREATDKADYERLKKKFE